jgi:hypothetical protein
VPQFDDPEGPFNIDENSPDGTLITTVSATDGDVDGDHHFLIAFHDLKLPFSEPFRKLYYELNLDYPDLANYFAVNGDTGEVTVQKRNGFELDRDKAPFGVYTIEILVRDNFPPTIGVPSTEMIVNLEQTSNQY